MRSKNIRFVLMLATISLLGITVAQIYWVRAAFNQEQDHFHRQVNAALNQVAEEFYTFNHISPPADNPIRQLSGNYYVVMVNSPINANLLKGLLKKAFKTRNIKTDFEYGIYNCDTECMVFDEYVSSEASPVLNQLNNLPVWEEANYYFGVYFPAKSGYLLNRMKIWMFTTIVLLVVILFFGYAMFIILKQKRLSEIQKDFISNMTHEFKTPISTIAVASEVLQQPSIVDEPERLLNYATIINKENKRLKGQVERVLQLASLENDALELEHAKISVHRIIAEAVAQFSIAHKQGVIDFSPKAKADVIMTDKHHFMNMVYNLIDNAIKYSSTPFQITLTTTNEDGSILISIKDAGIGVSESNQKLIFDKFYRVGTGNLHNAKGFGIGLSYVKLMTQEFGGSIRVKSSLGNGSIFIMKFKNA
ncbi:MAG: HAMP domain-containing histidine kinase [Cyclobacteriaceae bacterium]|nr:HAMP domain-containing histidine kinase [Cyclobacteriaceae bacterium]